MQNTLKSQLSAYFLAATMALFSTGNLQAQERQNPVPKNKVSINQISLEQRLTDDLKKSNVHSERGWYAKLYVPNNVIGKDPKVILLADQHDLSRSGEDYLSIIEILNKYADSFGIELGYQNKDPIEGQVEIGNTVKGILGKTDLRTAKDIIKKYRTTREIVNTKRPIYSLEDKNFNISAYFMQDFENFIRGNISKESTEEKIVPPRFENYKKTYDIIKKDYYPDLPDLDDEILADYKKFKDFLFKFYAAREKLIDKRSSFAVETIEKRLKENKNENLTVALYGSYHIPEISKSLGVPYILISNESIDSLVKIHKERSRKFLEEKK